MTFFKRVINISVGGYSGSDLRVIFNVNKTTKKNSNTASVDIYNLSESTRNSIRELDSKLTLSAGYESKGGAQLIFIGDVTRVNHRKNYPDIISSIEAGDGVKNKREKRQNFSYEEGTSVNDVLSNVAGALGLSLRELPSGIEGEYIQGFSYVGSVSDALDKVTKKAGLEWSIQNEELQIIKKNDGFDSSPLSISFLDGLLEDPERLNDIKSDLTEDLTRPGFRVKTLLNPQIEPGGKVVLVDGQAPGLYRVEQVNHSGDNFDGDFVSEFVLGEI